MQLPEEFVNQYADLPVPWGFGDLSYITFKRTYARPVDGENRSEEWYETCRRVIEGMFEIQKRHCQKQRTPWNEEKAMGMAMEAYDRLFHFKWTPPGRGLWMMGNPALFDRAGAGAFNCGFISTHNIDEDYAYPFTWSFLMSMLGVGVGFDTKGAGKITIQEPVWVDDTFVVADSREGWAELLETILRGYAEGSEVPLHVDYSQVRPKGAVIKTFGGKASGPGPLKEMVETIKEMYNENIGQEVTSELIVDTMNVVGRCVVSGGVRRTAQIALGDPSDTEFLDLKLDYEKLGQWRWASNNSIFAAIGMDYSGPGQRTAVNGEPGYIWLENMRSRGRMSDAPNHSDNVEHLGTNPCLPDWAVIMTSDGPCQIKDLMNKPFQAFLDGNLHSSETGFFKTGHQKVYMLHTKRGYSVPVTGNHKILTKSNGWVEAQNLETGEKIVLNNCRDFSWEGEGKREEGWLIGALLGDGYIRDNICKLEFWGPNKNTLLNTSLEYIEKVGGKNPCRSGYSVDDRDMVGTSSRFVFEVMGKYGFGVDKSMPPSVEMMSSEFQAGLLGGLFDTDGSVQGSIEKGVSVRLSSTRLHHLELCQKMLSNLGVKSSVYKNRIPKGYSILPDGEKKYPTKAVHELVISKDNIVEFERRIGFIEDDKKKALQDFIQSYKKGPYKEKFVCDFSHLEDLGEMDVYDCTVDDAHRFAANGIVVHNCSEQQLWNGELCTLVETYPAHHEDFEDYRKTLKCAYLYAKTITLLTTHDEKTNQVMMRNRRIGCSQTGVIQAINKFGYREFFNICDQGYRYLRNLDDVYSNWLGIPRSIKITSNKPAGTVSILSGSTPGVHWDHSPYYIRRIRIRSDSDLISACEQAGYGVEDCAYSPDTKVISFPVKVEHTDRCKTDVSAREKIDLASQMQYWWADNMVSCTVDFDRATEGEDIPRLLEQYEHRLKAISFLPREDHGYQQAPYEEITEEEYHEMMSKITPVGKIQVKHDQEDKFCDGEACSI